MKTNPKMSLSDSPESKSLLARYHEFANALGFMVADPVFGPPTGTGSRTTNKDRVEAYMPMRGKAGRLSRAVIRDTADEALQGLVDGLARDLRGHVVQMRVRAAEHLTQAKDFEQKAAEAEKVLAGES